MGFIAVWANLAFAFAFAAFFFGLAAITFLAFKVVIGFSRHEYLLGRSVIF